MSIAPDVARGCQFARFKRQRRFKVTGSLRHPLLLEDVKAAGLGEGIEPLALSVCRIPLSFTSRPFIRRELGGHLRRCQHDGCRSSRRRNRKIGPDELAAEMAVGHRNSNRGPWLEQRRINDIGTNPKLDALRRMPGFQRM